MFQRPQRPAAAHGWRCCARGKASEGVLDEQFVYDDGSDPAPQSDGDHWPGAYVVAPRTTSSDSQLTQGNRRRPLAFRLGSTTDFDDWMFLIDERVMLNRATMSKVWRAVRDHPCRSPAHLSHAITSPNSPHPLPGPTRVAGGRLQRHYRPLWRCCTRRGAGHCVGPQRASPG